MARIPGFDEGFNAEEVQPNDSNFSPLPEGEYVANIVASETKATRAGTGEYLSLQFKITEGDYENRRVFSNLNLVNPSSQAQDIARRTFSSICHAVGVLTPDDSTELHGIPMRIKVKIRPATDSYPETNDIVAFMALLTPDDGQAPW